MKKIIMVTAHKITRETVKIYGCSYSATLSITLAQIYASFKSAKNAADAENKIIFYSIKTMSELTAQGTAQADAAAGIVEMHYSEYKNKYNSCKTVYGSYDKKAKTIKVYAKVAPVTQKATHTHINTHTELCPICGSYCYGDCRENRAM